MVCSRSSYYSGGSDRGVSDIRLAYAWLRVGKELATTSVVSSVPNPWLQIGYVREGSSDYSYSSIANVTEHPDCDNL